MDKENLKELVGRGELEPAFAAMLGYGKGRKATAWYNALLIQYNQFKHLERDRLKGVISAGGNTRNDPNPEFSRGQCGDVHFLHRR